MLDSMRLSAETYMSFRPDIAIEDFGNKSLVFLSDSLQLRMINSTAKHLLALVSEDRTIQDIANEFSKDSEMTEGEALDSVIKSFSEMESQGIVRRRIVKHVKTSKTIRETSTIVANPDVVFWQSNDDKATLYLQDGDKLDVINSTAIEIWKKIVTPGTVNEILMYMHSIFPEVQFAQLKNDILNFLDHFFENGLILELENV